MREKLLLVIILILVGIGIGLEFIFLKKGVAPTPNEKEVKERAIGERMGEEVLPELTPEEALQKCEEIVKEPQKSDCYLELGKIYRDHILCDKISNQSKRAGCYGGIAGVKDLALCNEIKSLDPETDTSLVRMFCYLGAAIVRDDPNICTSIASTEEADACLAFFAGEKKDIAICEKIKGDKEMCYSIVAARMSNPEICERIEKGFGRDACYLGVVSFLEEEGKLRPEHRAICEKIEDEDSKDVCFRKF